MELKLRALVLAALLVAVARAWEWQQTVYVTNWAQVQCISTLHINLYFSNSGLQRLPVVLTGDMHMQPPPEIGGRILQKQARF
jgi:hypothetical protein